MLISSPHHVTAKAVARDFPLALELQYQVVRGPAGGIRGWGRTVWISSKQIVFETAQRLPPGTELEITIAWPALLERCVGLQLWVRGHVAHALTPVVTAAIHKYQFRTRSQAKAAGAGA